MATKKELLARAKELNIKGRWDMSVEQLEEAIEAQEAEAEAEKEEDAETVEDVDSCEDEVSEMLPELPTFDPASVKEAKRRYPSLKPRDSSGKVIRRGVKFNLNVPFREKLYFLDPRVLEEKSWTPEYAAAFASAPPQVRSIVRAMASLSITSHEAAKLGGQIIDAAKSAGLLETKINSRMLFAYYRRVLERVGVVHWAGAPTDPEDDE